MNDITVRKSIHWSSAELTDVGVVRPANEDAVFSNPDACFWAVADGMGGHAVGDVASRMIVDTLAQVTPAAGLSDAVEAVEQSLLDVNRRILEYSHVMFDRANMGSTVVSLLIRGRAGACLWVGDSRLYRFRQGELTALSRDHSLVQELVDSGTITPEEAQGHPQSHVITRAVGVDSGLKIDMNVFAIEIGDEFLLCSDGLYNAVPSEQICACMQMSTTELAVRGLIDTALRNGASDNVSAIVIKGEPEPF